MIDILLNIGLEHYLVLSLLLFFIGLLGVIISRNMLRTVMSLFILTVGIVINFTAFGCYCDFNLQNANMINLFVLMISVLQTVIALVVLYMIYRTNEYFDTEKITDKEL